MWKISCKPPDRHGLTLVEVVAGLALLATLLVSILMAFGAHASQIRAAQDRQDAVAAADDLLTLWMAGDGLPAVGEQDLVDPDITNMWWRITIGPATRHPTGLHTVVLEIIRRTPGMPDSVLTSVELFVMDRSAEAVL